MREGEREHEIWREKEREGDTAEKEKGQEKEGGMDGYTHRVGDSVWMQKADP